VDEAVAFTQVAVDEDGTVFAVGDTITPATTPAAEAPVVAERP
jgi:hypothetical protein